MSLTGIPKFLLIPAFLIFHCAHGNVSRQPRSEELIIVATTDFHSNLELAEGLASVVRGLHAEYGNRMLYLNAGDMFQGSLEGNLSRGRALIDFFNLLPLDASAIGNHELDFGKPVESLTGSRFPWLAANYVETPLQSCSPGPRCNALGNRTVFEPRAEFVRGGRKVGVIGITTPETVHITRRDALAGTTFLEMRNVLRSEIRYLRKKRGCDWVILLIHEGVHLEPSGKTRKNKGIYPLLVELDSRELDAVIAGHTHLRITQLIRGIPIMEAGYRGQVVGVLHLKGLSPHKRVARFDPWIHVPQSATVPDITAALEPYRARVADLKRKVIGNSIEPFPFSYHHENASGNLLADAILDSAKKAGGGDFALINAGGIRSPLPAGPIRYEDLFRTFPFENALAIVELTGFELRRVLEIAYSGELGMPAISGMTLKRLDVSPDTAGPWDRDLNNDGKMETWERNLLREIRNGMGQLIDDKKTYKLATLSFLANGGDYLDTVMDRVPKSRVHIYDSFGCRDLVAEFIGKNPDLDPTTFLDPDQPRIALLPVDQTMAKKP